MEHHFDVEIASEYGLTEAILLNNISFWLDHNIANDTNFYDGEYWTYNSIKAFTILFPYLTEKKIRSALAHLEEENIIKTGNFNKSQYDRTKWYTLTKKGKSIMPKRQMEISEMANGNNQKGEPIPYINTYIKTDIKHNSDFSNQPTSDENEKDNCFSETPSSPQAPLPPHESVLDKIPKSKPKKSKETRVKEWKNHAVSLLDNYNFSDVIKSKLETYFDYLIELGAMCPDITLTSQLDILAKLDCEKEQLYVLNQTIARGWKSLVYVADKKETNANTKSFNIGGNEFVPLKERQRKFDEMKNTTEWF